MEKETLCGVPHVVSQIPSDIDLAILNSAISFAIRANNKRGGKIENITIVAGDYDEHKTLQVKVDYER